MRQATAVKESWRACCMLLRSKLKCALKAARSRLQTESATLSNKSTALTSNVANDQQMLLKCCGSKVGRSRRTHSRAMASNSAAFFTPRVAKDQETLEMF